MINTSELCSKIWAKSKPYHPLERHMVDTGCMAQALLTDSCFAVLLPRLAKAFSVTEEKILQCVGFLYSLHDIGKCHPLFQQQCKDLEIVITLGSQEKLQEGDQSVYRHEALSARAVQELLRADGNHRSVARLWAEVIGLHHQRNYTAPVPIDPHLREFWEELLKDLQIRMRETFQVDQCQMNIDHSKVTAGYLLLGLLVLSDWLASGTEWFKHGQDDKSPKEYVEASRQSAISAVERLGLKKAVHPESKPYFNQIWPNIPREGMRPLQSACESFFKNKPSSGLLIIEAPMGEGKTEAAVYAGMQWIANFGLSGMYVALPTAATSNQMFDRIRDFLNMQGMQKHIKLLHGMAWLLDEDTPEIAMSAEHNNGVEAAWFRSSRKSLLTPWAVGTVDQSMLAALKVRFGALRLLGLTGKVLVIDEVHAYDVYMTVILERLLSWCGALDIPVILLSATLPSSRRRALMDAYTGQKSGHVQKNQPYPLLTYATIGSVSIQQDVKDVYIKRKVALKLMQSGLGNWDAVAQKALFIVEDNGCLCIIVNTVKEAQELYINLKREAPSDVKLMLFHARFIAGERQRIEQECLKAFDKRSMSSCPDCRPQKSILVATQVVEQSLDLDFDYMISAIAPVDLLLQRTGRLHRHTGRVRPESLKEPQLLVLLPEEDNFGSTEKVYDKWILCKTLEVIEQMEYIDIPLDMRPLIETVYDDTEPPLDHPHRQAWDRLCKKRKEHEQEARGFLIPAPKDMKTMKEQYWYEDDEGSNEWFRASTRLGGNTIQVLLLENDELEKLSPNMEALTRTEARRLMQSLVSVPSWWLGGLKNPDGSDPMVKGSGWLKGFSLLGLQGGIYTGFNDSGEQIKLVNDQELGVYYERM